MDKNNQTEKEKNYNGWKVFLGKIVKIINPQNKPWIELMKNVLPYVPLFVFYSIIIIVAYSFEKTAYQSIMKINKCNKGNDCSFWQTVFVIFCDVLIVYILNWSRKVENRKAFWDYIKKYYNNISIFISKYIYYILIFMLSIYLIDRYSFIYRINDSLINNQYKKLIIVTCKYTINIISSAIIVYAIYKTKILLSKKETKDYFERVLKRIKKVVKDIYHIIIVLILLMLGMDYIMANFKDNLDNIDKYAKIIVPEAIRIKYISPEMVEIFHESIFLFIGIFIVLIITKIASKENNGKTTETVKNFITIIGSIATFIVGIYPKEPPIDGGKVDIAGIVMRIENIESEIKTMNKRWPYYMYHCCIPQNGECEEKIDLRNVEEYLRNIGQSASGIEHKLSENVKVEDKEVIGELKEQMYRLNSLDRNLISLLSQMPDKDNIEEKISIINEIKEKAINIDKNVEEINKSIEKINETKNTKYGFTSEKPIFIKVGCSRKDPDHQSEFDRIKDNAFDINDFFNVEEKKIDIIKKMETNSNDEWQVMIIVDKEIDPNDENKGGSEEEFEEKIKNYFSSKKLGWNSFNRQCVKLVKGKEIEAYKTIYWSR